MNICTCNNCGNLYEDLNPSSISKDYKFRELPILELMKDEDGLFYGCPICKTDGYLVDDINHKAINYEKNKKKLKKTD